MCTIENYELDSLGKKSDTCRNIDTETLVLELLALFLDRCTVVLAAVADALHW